MLAQVLNPSIWRGLSHTLAWARHQLGKPIISSAAPAAPATLISVLHVFSVLASYRAGGIAQPQRIASGHILAARPRHRLPESAGLTSVARPHLAEFLSASPSIPAVVSR